MYKYIYNLIVLLYIYNKEKNNIGAKIDNIVVKRSTCVIYLLKIFCDRILTYGMMEYLHQEMRLALKYGCWNTFIYIW